MEERIRMKLAWICYDDDEEYPEVVIKFEEPQRG